MVLCLVLVIIIRHFFVVVILSYLDLDIHCEHFSFEEQCLISSIISVIPPGYDYHAGHWIKIKLICKFEKDEIKDWISIIQYPEYKSSQLCLYIHFLYISAWICISLPTGRRYWLYIHPPEGVGRIPPCCHHRGGEGRGWSACCSGDRWSTLHHRKEVSPCKKPNQGRILAWITVYFFMQQRFNKYIGGNITLPRLPKALLGLKALRA